MGDHDHWERLFSLKYCPLENILLCMILLYTFENNVYNKNVWQILEQFKVWIVKKDNHKDY